jgi:hypothetical protein
MPQPLTEIHHFTWALRVNIHKDPVVGVSLQKTTTVVQAPGHIYLKPMRAQDACTQALPKLFPADNKDFWDTVEPVECSGGALRALVF